MPALRSTLVLAAAVLALSASAASGAALPTLYANYTPNCTFAFVGDSGAAVTAPAPGTYQLVVATPYAFSNGLAACEFVEFHLTGPGVNLATDLGSGDSEVEQHTVTLQPSGTYVVQDDARPGQTRRTFTVSGSGSATPVATPSTGASPSTKGTPSKDPVGSAILPLRGALAASVSTGGKLTLLRGKARVSTLKSGRYSVRVVDQSAAAGFAVQTLKKSPTTLTARAFTGTRIVTLALRPGQWFFLTPGGTRHAFVVTA